MKYIKQLTLAIVLLMITISCSTDPATFVRVEHFNTIRITENSEHSNNTDPEENKKILPFILNEDRFDLLGGGVIHKISDDKIFGGITEIIEDLQKRNFDPTHLVSYTNDTKEADTICIYQNEDLIFYCRYAYNYSPFQQIAQLDEMGMPIELDKELDLKTVYFYIDIHPEKQISETSAEYIARASFRDFDTFEPIDEFKEIEIEVNNIALKPNDFHMLESKKTMTLTVGDRLIISISHPLLGYIEYDLIVPPIIDSFSVEPSMKMGEENSTKTFLLQWDKQNCDKYAIRAYRADANGELSSYGRSIDETFHQWDSYELEEDGEVVPFIEFEIKTSNVIQLDMFHEWSYIEVIAPTGERYGNYQSKNN